MRFNPNALWPDGPMDYDVDFEEMFPGGPARCAYCGREIDWRQRDNGTWEPMEWNGHGPHFCPVRLRQWFTPTE